MHSLGKQRGITMVEVLVSGFILSIGLLGLGALQTKSIRSNYDTQMQSLAVVQAQAMGDRMRSNAAGVADGSYDALAPSGSAPTSAETAAASCNPCTTTQTALRDFQEWSAANSSQLPNGQGTVTKIGNVYRVTVMWDSKKTGATGTACSGNPNVDLTCIRMDLEL